MLDVIFGAGKDRTLNSGLSKGRSEPSPDVFVAAATQMALAEVKSAEAEKAAANAALNNSRTKRMQFRMNSAEHLRSLGASPMSIDSFLEDGFKVE